MRFRENAMSYKWPMSKVRASLCRQKVCFNFSLKELLKREICFAFRTTSTVLSCKAKKKLLKNCIEQLDSSVTHSHAAAV